MDVDSYTHHVLEVEPKLLAVQARELSELKKMSPELAVVNIVLNHQPTNDEKEFLKLMSKWEKETREDKRKTLYGRMGVILGHRGIDEGDKARVIEKIDHLRHLLNNAAENDKPKSV